MVQLVEITYYSTVIVPSQGDSYSSYNGIGSNEHTIVINVDFIQCVVDFKDEKGNRLGDFLSIRMTYGDEYHVEREFFNALALVLPRARERALPKHSEVQAKVEWKGVTVGWWWARKISTESNVVVHVRDSGFDDRELVVAIPGYERRWYPLAEVMLDHELISRVPEPAPSNQTGNE